MKDLVCCSLDINIPMQSNAAERRLFDRTVEAIDYYCPIQPSTPTKLVFLWLAQLNLLVGPSTNLDRTKNKSFSDNCGKNNGDMSDKVGGKELVTEKELVMEEKLVTEEELMIEEEFIMKKDFVMEKELVMEKKLEMEEEIKMEDLEGLE